MRTWMPIADAIRPFLALTLEAQWQDVNMAEHLAAFRAGLDPAWPAEDGGHTYPTFID